MCISPSGSEEITETLLVHACHVSYIPFKFESFFHQKLFLDTC